MISKTIAFDINLDSLPATCYSIVQSATAEGSYIVQTRCPSDCGYVMLYLEPYIGANHFHVEWKVDEDQIPVEYFPSVVKGIKESAIQGLNNLNPIINVYVQVVYGVYHVVDSREKSFEVAAFKAFQKGLKYAGITEI
jgi:elongation factor G